MSYRRTYTHYETVHGSKTVSYPASESGGTITVSYSDTVTVNINVDVDTLPFDSSISRSCNTADVLTGAVVGMQAAQIAEIKNSASRVSDSMINGFYSLIRKDLSSQQSEVLTELKSRFALMMSISRDLDEKMERMESDVARLQRHYKALFDDMDANLEKRIGELNRPSFNLAEKAREEVVLDPVRKETAFGMSQTMEDGEAKRNLVSARISKKISDVLMNISSYISKCVNYKDTVDSVMEYESVQEPACEYIPAIICEQRSMQDPMALEHQYFIPEMESGDRIKGYLDQYAKSYGPAWRQPDPREFAQLKQAFAMCVEDASRKDNRDQEVSNRVYRLTMNLWQSNWENMKSL